MTYEIAQTHKVSLLRRIVEFIKETQALDELRDQIKKERAELAHLDDVALKDIGITREQAQSESRRRYHDVPETRIRDWFCRR